MFKSGWSWGTKSASWVLCGSGAACVFAAVLLLAGDGVAVRRTNQADGKFRQTVYAYGGWIKQEGDLQGVRTSQSRTYDDARNVLRNEIRRIDQSGVPRSSKERAREREQRTLENVASVHSAGSTARVLFIVCLLVALACVLTWKRSVKWRTVLVLGSAVGGLAVLHWYMAQIRQHTEEGLFIVRPKAPLEMTVTATWASVAFALAIVASGLTAVASYRKRSTVAISAEPLVPTDEEGDRSAPGWTAPVIAAGCTLVLALALLVGVDRFDIGEGVFALVEGSVMAASLFAVAVLLLLAAVLPLRRSQRRRSALILCASLAALGAAWLARDASDERVLLLLLVSASFCVYALLGRAARSTRLVLSVWILVLVGHFTPFYVLEEGTWVMRSDGMRSPSQATYVHRKNFFGLNKTGSLWIGESDVVRIRWFTFELNP